MKTLKDEEIKRAVRKSYGEIAKAENACACWHPSSCCGTEAAPTDELASSDLGYSDEDLASAPIGSNMGLGYGNPQAIASLQPGETVVDLGSGGGFDCFLAAKAVGKSGQVIGVDMTPEMVSRARDNAAQGGYENVDFRVGEIEYLPIPDSSVDVVVSNCATIRRWVPGSRIENYIVSAAIEAKKP
jgi:SAM-dependent methyltransferase